MALKSTGAIALEDAEGADRSISDEFGGNDKNNVKMSDYNRSHLPNREDGTDWPDYSSIPLTHSNLGFSLYRGKKALYTAKLTAGTTNFNGYLFAGLPYFNYPPHMTAQFAGTTVDVSVEASRLKVTAYDIARRYIPNGITLAGMLADNSDHEFTTSHLGNSSKYTASASSKFNSTTSYVNLTNRENVDQIQIKWVLTKAYVTTSWGNASGHNDTWSASHTSAHNAHFQNSTSKQFWNQGVMPGGQSGNLNNFQVNHNGAQFNKTQTTTLSISRNSTPLAVGRKMSAAFGVAAQMRQSFYGWPSPCQFNIVATALKLNSGGNIKFQILVTSGGHTTTHTFQRPYVNSLNPLMSVSASSR